MIYEHENIYEESEYLKIYPVINDVVEGYLKDYGVDITKYYFGEFTTWKDEDEVVFYCVYYGCIKNDDVTLGITIAAGTEKLLLEEFCLSLD